MDESLLPILTGLANGWQPIFESNSPLQLSSKPTFGDSSTWSADRSIADTLGLMAGHAHRAATSPQIIDALNQALLPLPTGERLEIGKSLKRIFRYIKNKVKFVEDDSFLSSMYGDGVSRDLLITPPALLSMASPKGDCDDFSMLGAAMCLAAGIPVSFVTVAADGRYPDRFTHVYLEAGGIPFDASHGDELGWETDRCYRKEIWPLLGVGKGMGMIVSGRNARAAFLAAGMKGLGDDSGDLPIDLTPTTIDNSSTDFLSSIMTGPNPTVGQIAAGMPSSSPASGIDNILASLTAGGLKIAQQVTQQPGVQTCNAQGVCSSTVLPAGYSGSLNIPGISGASGSSFIWILLAVGAVFLLNER